MSISTESKKGNNSVIVDELENAALTDDKAAPEQNPRAHVRRLFVANELSNVEIFYQTPKIQLR